VSGHPPCNAPASYRRPAAQASEPDRDDEQSVAIDPSLVQLAKKVVTHGLAQVGADDFRPEVRRHGWMTRLMDLTSLFRLDADNTDQLAAAVILGGDKDLELLGAAAARLGPLAVDALAKLRVGKGLLRHFAEAVLDVGATFRQEPEARNIIDPPINYARAFGDVPTMLWTMGKDHRSLVQPDLSKRHDMSIYEAGIRPPRTRPRM
jgi:hypothetical protein